MAHSPQHLAAAGLIADTFAPGSRGVPAASALGVPETMLDLAVRNPRAAERRQLDLLLKLWDGRALGTLNRGRPQREQLMLSLANSRVPRYDEEVLPWTGAPQSRFSRGRTAISTAMATA
jgi:hypothetical protein